MPKRYEPRRSYREQQARIVRAKNDAIERLVQAGVQFEDSGGIHIPEEAVRFLREERLRANAIAKVPSTPRHLEREAGGLAVRKGHGLFRTLTMESLRQLRSRSVLLQAIHRVRQAQVRRMSKPWDGQKGNVGWRIVHKDFRHPEKTPPEGIDAVVERATRMFACPHKRYAPTTAALLMGLVEDYLTINRPVLEPIYARYDDKRILGMRPADGAIIWPTLLWLEKWRSDHPQWSQLTTHELYQRDDIWQEIKETVGFDLWDAEYCLVREGTVEQVYPRDALIVGVDQNRTDISFAGYPPSHVEDAVEVLLAFKSAFDSNANYFTHGMTTDIALGIVGAYDEDAVEKFADDLRESATGLDRMHRPPIMSLTEEGDIKVIKLRESNKEMMFETWTSLLGAIGSAIYRMHPSSLNFKAWDGGSGPTLSAPSERVQINLAQSEGLQGDLQHVADNLLTPLLKRMHPELEWRWEYGELDEARSVDIADKEVKTARTRNEIRVARGEEPMGFWLPPHEYKKLDPDDEKIEKFHKNPWNMPADQPIVGQMQQLQMMEQGEQQPEQPGGGFGGEGMGEGDEFPFGQPGPGQQFQPPGQDDDDEPLADETQTQQPGQKPEQQQQDEAQPMNKARGRVVVYVEEIRSA